MGNRWDHGLPSLPFFHHLSFHPLLRSIENEGGKKKTWLIWTFLTGFITRMLYDSIMYAMVGNE